ncbi:hypothetical protein G1C97_0504 [Bifidobacterium sp. DSM 109959]|uniref:Uncharacterized protein n=2 Tax=Bifidobacterium olomucense TaxID=2675324 RepID=A0A7Y0EW66_9BIFI|nr:hypothetical protein [Bifidobacterium sp. DSM 109959]
MEQRGRQARGNAALSGMEAQARLFRLLQDEGVIRGDDALRAEAEDESAPFTFGVARSTVMPDDRTRCAYHWAYWPDADVRLVTAVDPMLDPATIHRNGQAERTRVAYPWRVYTTSDELCIAPRAESQPFMLVSGADDWMEQAFEERRELIIDARHRYSKEDAARWSEALPDGAQTREARDLRRLTLLTGLDAVRGSTDADLRLIAGWYRRQRYLWGDDVWRHLTLLVWKRDGEPPVQFIHATDETITLDRLNRDYFG